MKNEIASVIIGMGIIACPCEIKIAELEKRVAKLEEEKQIINFIPPPMPIFEAECEAEWRIWPKSIRNVNLDVEWRWIDNRWEYREKQKQK